MDKFHGIHTAKAAEFCRVARRVFGRDNIVSLSYASRQPDQGLEPVHDLAAELDAVVDWSDVLRPLPAGVAGTDDDAELEPPGPGGAGRAASAGPGTATGSRRITARGRARR